MGRTKYFDIDNNNQLINATKLYINSKNYEVESQKTTSNFDVDILMANTISLLNQKGYHTLSSNAGHVYHYFINKKSYFEEDLKVDNRGNKYMYVMYHNEIPVKYELISKEETSQEDLTMGIFKVTFPIIKIYIVFANQYSFTNLPRNWYFNHNDNTLINKIYYDFDNLDFQQLHNNIVKANKELFHWAEELPMQ